MDSNWPRPCVSQPEESVVCGCGPQSFVPGKRVIYLTQAEPTELCTYQSVPRAVFKILQLILMHPIWKEKLCVITVSVH